MVLPNKRPKAQHFPAMDYAAVPAFIRRLEAVESVGALCLRFAILTGSRSGEVRKATWDEVDMANAFWTLPYTQHGFRSSFLNWAGDEPDFDRESIELCISHKDTTATEAAYRRKDALKKRRVIMQAWADFLS